MEKWVDIKGYEGLYQVSDSGLCRSVDRKVTTKKGDVKNLKGVILSKREQRSGHLSVCLSKNGKVSQFLVHRLVGFHFLDGYFEGACIRHLDGDPKNNRASNLKWGTVKDNSEDMYIRHGKRVGRSSHFCKYTEETIDHVLSLKGKISSAQASKITGVSRRYISTLWKGEAAFQRVDSKEAVDALIQRLA